MTIKEFLAGLQTMGNKELAEEIQNTTSVWNNYACKGYCIAAMQAAGYTREQIEGVLVALTAVFDDISVDDAARIRNT